MTPDDRAPDRCRRTPAPPTRPWPARWRRRGRGCRSPPRPWTRPLSSTGTSRRRRPVDDAALAARPRPKPRPPAAALATSPFDESSFNLDAPIRSGHDRPCGPRVARRPGRARRGDPGGAAHPATARPRGRCRRSGRRADPGRRHQGSNASPSCRPDPRPGRCVAFALALFFAGGVALGVTAFQRTQPAPTLVGDLRPVAWSPRPS